MNKRQLEIQKISADDEQRIIRQLKQVYNQAAKDCAAKIQELSMRTDLENIQSIVYQKQYQEAIKKQIDGILNDLNSKSFTSIADYLGQCYETGFIGTLYDLQGQGIPLCFPINQEDVVQALQVDSKISQGLYQRMGEDTNRLKKSIKAELSRGISNGSSWVVVAGIIANGMNTPFDKAYKRAVVIARTEGHRVQQQSTLHCQQRAKSKGADVLKQWDSTLDGVTRPTHRELDGQIREIDEPFEVAGMKTMYPGAFGNPAEDCNCRCCLLQRARWALSKEEYVTKFNGDVGELVKIPAKSYDEFHLKAKYASMSYADKQELIYKNQQKIDKLRMEKKSAESEMLLGSSVEEMQIAQKKAQTIQDEIATIKKQNKEIAEVLGIPKDAKERFLAQSTDFSKLPQDIADDELGAIGSWTRTGHTSINDYLRTGNKGVYQQYIQDAETLKSMIDRNIVEEPITVKRGTDFNAMNHLFGSDEWRKEGYNVNGKVICDYGFMATSPDLHGGFGGNIQMYIDIPKGAKGIYIGDKSAAPDEKEFLLQCGTKFDVDKIEIDKDQWGESIYSVYMKVKVENE